MPSVETFDALLFGVLCFVSSIFVFDLRDDVDEVFLHSVLEELATKESRQFSEAVDVACLARDAEPLGSSIFDVGTNELLVCRNNRRIFIQRCKSGL